MELVSVGKIIKAYSLKGAVKVAFEAFFMEFVPDLEVIFLEQGKNKIPYFIEDISFKENQPVMIKLEGINTKEEATAISRRKVFVDKSLFPDIEEAFDEQHDWDYLIEYTAFEQTEIIGKVKDIFYTTHQITAQILNKEQKEILIPLHEDFIVEIDEDQKQIKFELPEGLLEL